MPLTRVTITGADDAVDVAKLARLSWDFPFVEWGILFSQSRAGTPRYPTEKWRDDLFDAWSRPSGWEMNLSAHFCGEIARRVLVGDAEFLDDTLRAHYRRVQLNGWNGPEHSTDRLGGALRNHGAEFILQVRDAGLLSVAATQARAIVTEHTMVSALWDCSGGRGLESTSWPRAPEGLSLGYAGGITPDNVLDVLTAIGPRDENFWIDMESGVRTDDRFDVAKARRVLELTQPLVPRRP